MAFIKANKNDSETEKNGGFVKNASGGSFVKASADKSAVESDGKKNGETEAVDVGNAPQLSLTEVDYKEISASLKKELAAELSSPNFDKEKVRPLVENYASAQFKLFDENLKKGYTGIKPIGENLTNLFKAHSKNFNELYPDLAEIYSVGNLEKGEFGSLDSYAYQNSDAYREKRDKDQLRFYDNAIRQAENNAEKLKEEQREQNKFIYDNTRRGNIAGSIDETILRQNNDIVDYEPLIAKEQRDAANLKYDRQLYKESVLSDEKTEWVKSQPDFEEKTRYIKGTDGKFHDTSAMYDTDNMGVTKEEYLAYVYITNTEGEDAAIKFLESIKNKVRASEAVKESNELQKLEKENPASAALKETGYALASGVEGLAQSASGIVDTFSGRTDYFMPGKAQLITQKNKEASSFLGNIALSAAEGLPQVAGTMALGAVNPYLGTAFLASTAYGSGYVDAINSGASRVDAVMFGGANAILEVALERAVGSTINNFGDPLSKRIGKGVLGTKQGQKIAKSFAEFANKHPKGATAISVFNKWLGNSSSEFVEEYLSETATPLLRNAFLGEENELSLGSVEQLQAGLVGFITGGILEGVRASKSFSNILKGGTALRIEQIMQMSDARVIDEYLSKISDAEIAFILSKENVSFNELDGEGMMTEIDKKRAEMKSEIDPDKARREIIDSEKLVAIVAPVAEFAKQGLSYDDAIETVEKSNVDVSGFEEFAKAAYEKGAVEKGAESLSDTESGIETVKETYDDLSIKEKAERAKQNIAKNLTTKALELGNFDIPLEDAEATTERLLNEKGETNAEQIVSAFSKIFANGVSKESLAYQNIEGISISFSGALADYVINGKIPDGIRSVDLFKTTAEKFKEISDMAVRQVSSARNMIYGNSLNISNPNSSESEDGFSEENKTLKDSPEDDTMLSEAKKLSATNDREEIKRRINELKDKLSAKYGEDAAKEAILFSADVADDAASYSSDIIGKKISGKKLLPSCIEAMAADNDVDAVAAISEGFSNIFVSANISAEKTHSVIDEVKERIVSKRAELEEKNGVFSVGEEDVKSEAVEKTAEGIIATDEIATESEAENVEASQVGESVEVENKREFSENSGKDEETTENLPEVLNLGENAEPKEKTSEKIKPYAVTKTKHTSTGEDIWVVSLNDKISKEEFAKLRDEVKKNGGYYSRFAKTLDGKALPGFVFKSEPGIDVLSAFGKGNHSQKEMNNDVNTSENQEQIGSIIDSQETGKDNNLGERLGVLQTAETSIELRNRDAESLDTGADGRTADVSGNRDTEVGDIKDTKNETRRLLRRTENRSLEEICESENFVNLSQFIGNEISPAQSKTFVDAYIKSEYGESEFDLMQLVAYDVVSDENNNLREIFLDNIDEYFLYDSLDSTQDITGKAVPDEVRERFKNTVVKNSKGSLIPVYHGTDRYYDRLKRGETGIHFGSFAQAANRAKDKGFDAPYFVKAYLNITNPAIIEDDFFNWNAPQLAQALSRVNIFSVDESIEYAKQARELGTERANTNIVERLKELGYDGIVYQNAIEAVNGKSYIVFDEYQIFRLDGNDNPTNKENVENEREQTGILGTESEGHPGGNVSEEAQEVEEGRDVGRNGDDGSQDSVREVREDARLAEGEQTSSDRVQYREPDTGRDFDGELREHTDSEGRSDRTSDTSSRRLNSHNYKITEDIDSKRPNITDNIEAIKLLKSLEESGKKPTKEQQAILARYKGWGGLKNAFTDYYNQRQLKELLTDEEFANARASILNAHYTSTKVISGIYKGLARLGFKGGNVLEPSMGVGNFFGVMPGSIAGKTNLYGVEMDSLTGRIAKMLYPDAAIEISPFQDVKYPEGSFDAVVGNVPFSEITFPYKGGKYTLHDYFFLKTLDTLKEGGVAMLLTSTGTLDKLNVKARHEIAKRANLVAAFRLPNNAFETNAGTSVTTDLIVLQKRGDTVPFNGEPFEQIGRIGDIPVNEYFVNHPENILGKLVREKGMYAQERTQVEPFEGDFEKLWNKAISRLPKDLLSSVANDAPIDIQTLNSNKSHFEEKDGKVIFFDSETGKATEQKGKSAERAKGYIAVKDAYNNLLESARNGASKAERDALRKVLSDTYDSFNKKFGFLQDKVNSSLEDDAEFVKTSGLELYNPKTKKFEKSGIFTSDTIGYIKPAKADTSVDALAISINESGRVDFKRMSELVGKSKEEIAAGRFDAYLEFLQKKQDTLKKELESVKADIDKPFKYQAQLDKAIAEQADIDSQLNFGEDNSDVVEDMNDEFEENNENLSFYFLSEEEIERDEERNSKSLFNWRRWRNVQRADRGARRLYEDSRRNFEQSQEERKSYIQKVKESGKTRRVRISGLKIDVVSESAYNEEMTAIAELNGERGIKTRFIASVPSAGSMKFGGFTLKDGTVYICYDAKSSPWKTNKHELSHNFYNSDSIKVIKRAINAYMTEAEILKLKPASDRYKNYYLHYKGNVDRVYEEFVCNVMDGSETLEHPDIQKLVDAYWNSDFGFIDNYEIKVEGDDVGTATENTAPDWLHDILDEVFYPSLDDDGNYDFGDAWYELLQEHGYMPKGENPVRDVDVPKKIDERRVVSRFARTMMEAGVTPDHVMSEFEERILDGTMTHLEITNEAARSSAQKQIEYEGFEGALTKWNILVGENVVGKKQLVFGMELYNQCITNGDVTNAMKIAADLTAMATSAGQTLQACRVLKLMSPDGQLYYLEKSVDKMNEEFKKKIGEKFKDIELDESLMKEFLQAQDEESKNVAYDKICQSIADQIPSTLRDKWDSWRYLAMLGNPRTHIKNFVGNAVFVPAIRIKNMVGAIGERAFRVNKEERTRSFYKTKESKDFAKADFEIMKKTLQGENAKYATTGDIESRRTIFKNKLLETLRRKNFDFLEAEDMTFLKLHYVDALARVITARKIDVNNIDPETLDKIRLFAVRQAQEATYRDANALAEELNRIERAMKTSDKKAVRAASVLVEGVMPFKKTPLNIAKQGILYSPVSILTGVSKAVKVVKRNGDVSITEAIDDLSKGLTGTGLVLLGYFLASLDLISGPDDEDEKKNRFDEMVGEQSYSFKAGGHSYTIDWMTPSSMPLFVGCELFGLTKDKFTFSDITAALSSMTDPVFELSVLSGISNLFSGVMYGEGSAAFNAVWDMTTSYFTQALPTVGGQVSRLLDDNKREYYYTDKNSQIPSSLQRLIGQVSSKIPFVSYLFEPSVDDWGREESYGGSLERLLENTVSPGYYSKETYTRVDDELSKLYRKTGDNSVFPTRVQKYYVSDGVYYYMNAEDYTEVKKRRGKLSFKLVKELISSQRYKEMSDEEKAKAISKCYREAGETVKGEMLERIKRHSK